MVARLISVCAPSFPRSRKRGCPKIRYLSVANGCSTVDRRSRMTCGVVRCCIRCRASSCRCRVRKRCAEVVQRVFSGQLPQTSARPAYITARSLRASCLRTSLCPAGQQNVSVFSSYWNWLRSNSVPSPLLLTARLAGTCGTIPWPSQRSACSPLE